MFISWVVVSSCGYRFGAVVNFPGDVERIYITIFENTTSETGIENIITNQLIDEFTRRRPAAVVSRKSDADALLTGIISSLRISTVSRRGEEIPNERRVWLQVDLKLTSTEGKVLWRSGSISGTQAYAIDLTDQLKTEGNKLAAITSIAVKLAEISYYQLTQKF